MFFKGSRYANVPTHEILDPVSGRVVRYKTTRFIPETRAQRAHRVRDFERLDHIAFQHYRDAERFWRICDANAVMRPRELVADAGRRILIPPAEG
jgi:hypothetical protein